MWLRFGSMWRLWTDIFLVLKYLLTLQAHTIIHFMHYAFWIIVAYIYEMWRNPLRSLRHIGSRASRDDMLRPASRTSHIIALDKIPNCEGCAAHNLELRQAREPLWASKRKQSVKFERIKICYRHY